MKKVILAASAGLAIILAVSAFKADTKTTKTVVKKEQSSTCGCKNCACDNCQCTDCSDCGDDCSCSNNSCDKGCGDGCCSK